VQLLADLVARQPAECWFHKWQSRIVRDRALACYPCIYYYCAGGRQREAMYLCMPTVLLSSSTVSWMSGRTLFLYTVAQWTWGSDSGRLNLCVGQQSFFSRLPFCRDVVYCQHLRNLLICEQLALDVGASLAVRSRTSVPATYSIIVQLCVWGFCWRY